MTAESIEVAPQELYLTEDDFEEDTNRRAEVTLWRTKISVVLHDKRTFSVLGVAYLPHRHIGLYNSFRAIIFCNRANCCD